MATKKRKTTTRRTSSRKKRAEQRLPAGLGTLFAGLLLVVLAFVEGDSAWKALHDVLFGLFGCGSFVLGAAVCCLAVQYTRGEDLLPPILKLILGLVFACGTVIVFSDIQPQGLSAFQMTAACYANAYIGKTDMPDGAQKAFGADIATINPYLGVDGVKPFADACRDNGTGVFVLVKTSNPSSGQLQDLRFEDGRTLYQAVADLVEEWGEETRGESGYSAVGAVVGATYPQQGVELRARMPHAFFLVPGYGAQGAKGTDIAGCFDANGNGAIVNASRSILCAWKKREGMAFDAAARDEALRMKEDLCSSLKAVGKEIK